MKLTLYERSCERLVWIMRYYKFLQICIVLFAICYAAIGFGTWHWYRFEIFPFFAWELFSGVPGEIVDFGVKITHINGQTLIPPRYFEFTDTWFDDARSVNAQVNIQGLGVAVAAQNDAEIQRRRTQFEELHLKNHANVHYELYRRRYYPLDRWHTGQFLNEELLASFQTTPP